MSSSAAASASAPMSFGILHGRRDDMTRIDSPCAAPAETTVQALARVEAECDWSDALTRLAEALAAAQAERPAAGARRPVD